MKNGILKISFIFKQNIWENGDATDSNRLPLYSEEIGPYLSVKK